MNLPNKLTMLRILMIPLFMVFIELEALPNHVLWAFVVFVLASLTDLLDGKIARKYNLVTDFGKFMDPLADKLLVTAALVYFIPMGLAAGVAAPLMIAAVMSGVTLGYSLCFYADAVLMTTAGSGVSSLTTIRAATPYALAVGGLSVIALLVAGL